MILKQLFSDATNVLGNFFFSDSSSSDTKASSHVPTIEDLDQLDKNFWEATLSFELDGLREDIATIGYKTFQKLLDDLQADVGKFTLSPYHYHVQMRDFTHDFVEMADSIEHYKAKLILIKRTNAKYKEMISDTLFMEHCLEGELIHLDAVFQGQRQLFGGSNCLNTIFYYKDKVSPLLYHSALNQIVEMLKTYKFEENFGGELHRDLEGKLKSELFEAGMQLESAPKKLPLLWVTRAQTQPKKNQEVEAAFMRQVMRSVFKLISVPITHPKLLFVTYSLLFPTLTSAMSTIVEGRAVIRKPVSKSDARRRDKRFTNVSSPFQISLNGSTTPAVAPWGPSDFMAVWINSTNTGTGAFLSSVDGSSLNTLPPISLTLNSTVATGTAALGSIVGYIQQVSSTNFTMSGYSVDSTGAASSTFPLFSSMTSRRGALSQNFFSTGGFAGVVEINDGSGSGIQLKYFNAAGGTVCTVTANSVTTGNQLYPSVDVTTDNGAIVVWTNEKVAGTGVGFIEGQKFGANCAFQGSVLTLDNSSQFLTLPWVSQLPSGFSGMWFLNNATSSTYATYQQSFDNSGSPQFTKLTLDNLANTNGNHPITIGLKAGGSANFWQACTIFGDDEGAGSNILQFVGKNGSPVGSRITITIVAYCRDISAAVSQDGNNILLGWTDEPSTAPPTAVLAAGINLNFIVTNQNTINTFTENTQLSVSHPPQYQLPNYNPGNVTITFTYDTAAGNLTVTPASGLIISYNPFLINGNLNVINQALNTLTYVPTTGYVNDFNITVEAVDIYGLAPMEIGQISMMGKPSSSASPTTVGSSPLTTGGPSPTAGTGQTTGSNTASPTTGGNSASPSTSGSSGKSFPVGAVAGGAGAGVLCIGGIGTGVFFAARRYQKDQRLAQNRRRTNIGKLADGVFERLNLIEFKDFDDGAAGASFLSIITLMTEIWRTNDSGRESIDIEQKLNPEIHDLATFLADSIENKVRLTKSVSISKASYGIYNKLDLVELRAQYQAIAGDVLTKLRDKQSLLLNANTGSLG